MSLSVPAISEQLYTRNFCHIPQFSDLIGITQADEVKQFQCFWSRLVRDEAFKGYTFRERRILRYRSAPAKPLLIDRNVRVESTVRYKIDYDRSAKVLTYAEDAFIESPFMTTILALDMAILAEPLSTHEYSIDIHQFRVKADRGEVSPTTSGIHQDGLEWVFVHHVSNVNSVPVVS